MMRHGILILAHGTPSEAGTRAFLAFGEEVAARAGNTPVTVGFMEFASPTFADGVETLRRQGVTHIAAVPAFLSMAGHTSHDLPPALEQLKKTFPELSFHLTAHVGSHPKVVELSAWRYREALVGRASVSAEETCVVLAAHGSPEPEAFAEFEVFAASRRMLTPVGRLEPCFSQMGRPRLHELLPTLLAPLPLSAKEASITFKRIVVQPHFIQAGRLVDSIRQTVDTVAQRHPEIEWIVTEPLGSHVLLADALIELGGSVKEWVARG